MTYVISVLNMVRSLYLETRGLGIVVTNHIFLQKENHYHVKSKRKLCLGIMMKQKEWNMI